LASGVYTVIVTDNVSGCEQSITFVLNDNVPPADVDITNSNIITSCPGAADATVVYTVTPSPGFIGNPIVTIVDMNGFPVAAENLAPGEYCILVRDTAGCLAGSACFEVSDPSQIDVDIAVLDVDCGTPGTISLSNIVVGTAPYEIVWPTIIPAPTDPEKITNLQQGVYNFILTDANGCAVNENVTVGGVSAPDSPMLADVVSCDEVTFLNVNSPGNVVSWFNCDGTLAGPNPLEVTVSDTTCYYAEITNSDGCVVKDSVNVIEAPLPMADFTYELSPCADTAFVQFTDASTSASGGMITSWNWLFSNGVTSNEQNPGVYVFEEGDFIASLTVTNDFGCSDTFIDTIQVSILISIAPPIEINVCPGEEADLFPGADESLTYNWSPADSLTDATSPNPMSTVNTNTTYMVTITSADGLCEVVRTVDLIFSPMVTLQLGADTVLCEGGNIMVSGSTNGTDICWYDSNGLASGVAVGCGNNISLPGLDPSDPYYYAIAEDTSGCTVMDSMMVTDYSISIALEPQEDLCAGDTLFMNPLYTLNSETHDFMWTPLGSDTETIMVSPNETTTYEVTVSNDFCETTESFEVVVRDVSQEAALTADPDTIFLGQTSQLQALLESGVAYEWSNPETLIFSDDQSSPIAAPLETTDYTVTIIDELECAGDATVRVVVIDECDEPYIFFPNAFSPNDDGHNDILYLRGFNADEVHFVIYNRWGEKVFESNSQGSGWDGSYKGETLCSDVYGFYLRVLCRNGQEYIKKGNVTLLR
jgi:gliding motility-associated-like protein